MLTLAGPSTLPKQLTRIPRTSESFSPTKWRISAGGPGVPRLATVQPKFLGEGAVQRGSDSTTCTSFGQYSVVHWRKIAVSLIGGPSSLPGLQGRAKARLLGPSRCKANPSNLKGEGSTATLFSPAQISSQHPLYNFTISEQISPLVARLPATGEQRISFLDQRDSTTVRIRNYHQK